MTSAPDLSPAGGSPPAGFYPDPLGGDVRRWWDGYQWTVSMEPRAPAMPAAQPWTPVQPGPPAQHPWLPAQPQAAPYPPAGWGTAPTQRQPQQSTSWQRDVRPGGASVVLAYVTAALLVINAVLGALAALAALHRVTVVKTLVATPSQVDRVTVSNADRAVQSLMGLRLGLLAITGAAFVAWLYLTVVALRQRRPEAFRYAEWWAIVGWIVPIMSLFRPKQMVDDAWRASYAGGTWSAPAALNWWWGAWLLTNFSYVTLYSTHNGVEGPAALILSDRILAAGCAVSVLAAALAVYVVISITQRAQRAVPADSENEGARAIVRW